MGIYVVSYDLMRPGQLYPRIHDAIKRLGPAVRPLQSFWLLRTPLTAAQVRDSLVSSLDANDKLVVAEVGGKGECAWHGFVDNRTLQGFFAGSPINQLLAGTVLR